MRTRILVTVAVLVALVVGYLAGRSTHDKATQQELSLYIADVALVDAQTGTPINTKLHYPEGFLPTLQLSESGSRTIAGTGHGPISTEQDAETGRCRIIWIGTPSATFGFRFSADGYQPVELPPKHIREVAHSESIGGIVNPPVIRMTRSEPNSRNDATADTGADAE